MRSYLPAVVFALGVATLQAPVHAQGTIVAIPTPAGEAPAPSEGESPDLNQPALAPSPASDVEQTSVSVTVFKVAEGRDLTVSSASLWERVRFGFAMPDCKSPLVAEHLAAYLNRPEYFARVLDRSRRYLHHIVEEVEKRGMPTEIALLPMIESAYNPVAYSPARASGIWQFIPSTGRSFGLDQTRWYDERRDVVQATEAALDYLEMLYETFGSWDLALAAYNSGEGTVGRAISKNAAAGLPTDYLSLQLPAETRNYVPKLQAVKNLVANPERYGLTVLDIPNQAYFVAVSTERQMDAEAAARLAGISLAEFVSLNPAYNRQVVIPGGDRALLVPVDKADQFEANLESNRGPLVTWRTYTVRHKERLDRIASYFGMPLGRLAEVNGLTTGTRLKPGQTLLVQGRGQATDRVEDSIAAQLALVEPAAASAKAVAASQGASKVATNTKSPSMSKQFPQARKTSASSAKASTARDSKSKPKKTVLARASH